MSGFYEILLQSWSPKILHELLVNPLMTVRFAETDIFFEKKIKLQRPISPELK